MSVKPRLVLAAQTVQSSPPVTSLAPLGQRWVIPDADLDDPAAVPARVSRREEKVESSIEPLSRLYPLLGAPQRLPSALRSGRSGRMGLPPEINTSVATSHTYRFRSTSASFLGITYSNLVGAMGGVCSVVNSKVQPFTSSIKLLRVTVWPAASTSTPDSVLLTWSAGTASQVVDDVKTRSIPEGVTATGAVTFTPPPRSLAADWLVTSAGIFAISSPVGSIVDVHIQGRLSNIYEASNITVAAGTLGLVYYLALDGASSNTYIPIGVPTTA